MVTEREKPGTVRVGKRHFTLREEMPTPAPAPAREPMMRVPSPFERPTATALGAPTTGGAIDYNRPLMFETPTGEQAEAWIRPDNTVWRGKDQIGAIDPTTGQFTPRQPTTWEEYGQAFQQLGIWGVQGLGYLFKPFELFHEYVAKPFSIAVTTPGWQKTWWESQTPEFQRAWLEKGYEQDKLPIESPLKFIKELMPGGEFRKAYEEWEAPKYLRGGIELIPWFLLPPMGRIASMLGKFGTVGKVGAKALTPYVLLEKGAAKIITTPIKIGGKVVAKLLRPKEIQMPDLRPIEEILIDTRIRHPERLRKGNYVQQIFEEVNRVKLVDEEVRDSSLRASVGWMNTTYGSMSDLLGIKSIQIKGTKLTHDLVALPGLTPKVQGGSMAAADVLSKPQNYNWPLTIQGQKAKHYAEDYRRAIQAAVEHGGAYVEQLREFGIEVTPNFIPTRVIGKVDPKTGVEIIAKRLFATGERPGTITPSLRPKKFTNQMSGIKAGFQYAPQDEVMDTFIREIYNMEIAARGKTILDDLGKIPSQLMDEGLQAQKVAITEAIADLKFVQGIADQAGRGAKLSKTVLARVGKISPDAEMVLRAQSDRRGKELSDLHREVASLQSRLAIEVEAATVSKTRVASEVGTGKTVAVGADPRSKYEFKFEAVESDTLIASHTEAYTINPQFPRELQPRLRERAISRDQIERMGRDLDPEALLVDTHRLDSGSMLVASDSVVESGNARIMAIRRAIESSPERYAAYRGQLEATAHIYGLDPATIKAMKSPVLIRRRITEVADRASFARGANESISALMSPVELAFADARLVPEAALERLQIEGKETIEDALMDLANSDFIKKFLANVPQTERAQFLTTQGGVSRTGVSRISNAILAKAFPGRFGLRLAELNIETVLPSNKMVIAGLAGVAGDLAKLAGGIQRGIVKDEYHISLDIAEAADRFLRAKANNLPIEAFMQPSLFEGGASPIQQALMKELNKRSRSATQIRDFIREYVNQAMAQPPPGQAMMPGMFAMAREEILGSILGEVVPKSAVLKPAVSQIVEKAAVPEVPKVAKRPPVEVTPREPLPEGMKPTPGTLEYDAYIRTLTPEARAAELETRKAVEPFVSEFEAELSMDRLVKNINERLIALRADARTLKPDWQAAKYRATHATLTEGRVDLPAWRNRIFTDIKDETGRVVMTGRAVAEKIMDIYGPQRVNSVLQVASGFARMGVTIKAALDLSWSFIQGMLPLGYDIARWAQGKPSFVWVKATRAMIKTMANPKYADEWVLKNPAEAKAMAEFGVIMERQAEFIQAGTLEARTRQLPLVGPFLGSLIKQTYGRAGAGFSTAGMVARGEIWKGLRGAWEAEGYKLPELGEFANKLTGVVSSRELGVSATRRALESATLFAPRYTRAYLMVMRDLFRGTKTGSEVRKAMAGMVAGGFLGYTSLCVALGQEPRLNPAPKSLGGDGADFMAFKIGNSTIGLPGFWYSTIRMLAAVNAVTEEDPEKLLSLNWRENDFLQWVMSRTSPLVGFGREIIEGRDYLGKKLDEPSEWFHNFSQYLLTIAMANLITRHPSEEEGKYKRVGAELLGLRAFPQSEWNKAKDKRDEYANKEFSKGWDKLNREQKDKIEEQHTDYKVLADRARDEMTWERGDEFEVALQSTEKQAEAIYHAGIEDAARSLISGQIDYPTYLSQEEYLRRVMTGKRWAMNYIEGFLDPGQAEDFRKWLDKYETPEDAALSRYWDIRNNPVVTAGVPNWDATEDRTKSFLDSLDDGTRQYVLRNKDRWLRKLPPAARILAEIQSRGRDIVDEYYDQPEGKARLQYRRANPTVEAWLLIMGRITVPQTAAARRLALELLQQRGIPAIILPRLSGGEARMAPAPRAWGASGRPAVRTQPTAPPLGGVRLNIKSRVNRERQ